MDDTTGLGPAMAQSYTDRRIMELEQRLGNLEQRWLESMKILERLVDVVRKLNS